jgi:hypothetical protein
MHRRRTFDDMAGAPGAEHSWAAEDFAAMGALMESFTDDLAASGELVETRGLAVPAHTRRVRLQQGVPVVTDGPCAETQEVLAGYWVVECDGIDDMFQSPTSHSSFLDQIGSAAHRVLWHALRWQPNRTAGSESAAV